MSLCVCGAYDLWILALAWERARSCLFVHDDGLALPAAVSALHELHDHLGLFRTPARLLPSLET